MTQVQIRKLSPSVGAEVQGVDFKSEISADTWRQLCQAFDEMGVLVFRDVDVDVATQHYVVETLHYGGDMSKLEGINTEGFGYVSNKEEDGGAPYGRLLYHVDMHWSEIPFQTPSLYGYEVEPGTAPTTFVNTVHSWATLPDEMKERLKGLTARHESGQQGRGNTSYEAELIQPDWARPHETITPVAMKHPRTGQTMLYVCEQQTREIVGLPKAESDALLDQLFAHIYRPELIIEHHWRTRDLVIWDNMSIQHSRHYVEGGGPVRTLRKIHAPFNELRQYMAKLNDIPQYADAEAY
jgi:alpha-ketoglutarate-dependent taurine dioxygenase